MSEIKFCFQLNIYLVEIRNFMNGGDFLDFNLLLFQIGHVYHVGKYNVSENVQNIEIYIFSFKKFLKNKCEISIN